MAGAGVTPRRCSRWAVPKVSRAGSSMLFSPLICSTASVIAFDHAYHGRTNLTMALTAKNMPYKDKFGPFAGEIYRMPMAYPLRWPGGPEACKANALDMVKTLIHTQV